MKKFKQFLKWIFTFSLNSVLDFLATAKLTDLQKQKLFFAASKQKNQKEEFKT